MVNDVHTCHIKGPNGTLYTQSLILKYGTTVKLKCKSTLMTFNTTISTMEEVENLPKYQIAFKDWDPQRYYDDSHVSDHNQSNQDKENFNTKATLFFTSKHPILLLANSSPSTDIKGDISMDDSNSLMPNWNKNISTNSTISSIPSLESRYNDSYNETSIDTVTVFSSRFFPQHTLDPNDKQIHEDDDISILICIQQ